MRKMPIGTKAEWLKGGGELGEFIRAKDWSTTPLGSREKWPQSLRTAVCLIVDSKRPISLVWGAEGALLYNDAYREYLGPLHPQALGQSAREFWNQVWAAELPQFESALANGESFEIRAPARRAATPELLLLHCTPVRAEHGTVGGFLISVDRDMSGDSEARLQAAIEGTAVGWAMADLEGRILTANTTYCQILGYELAELQGKRFTDLIHPDDLAANQDLIKKLFAGEISSFRTENRYVCKDGRFVWVRKSASLIRDERGQPRWATAVIEDITARKQAEEKAVASSASLARELQDAKVLQKISGLLIPKQHGERMYEEILEAAIAIMHADCASIQLIDQGSNTLRLLASKNFHPDAANFWRTVNLSSSTRRRCSGLA